MKKRKDFGVKMTDKKKPMKKKAKDMKQGSILLQLHENRLLSSKVDEALDSGETYDYIIELCAEYDLEISKASVSRYKSKRAEAIKEGVPLAELLDQRKKSGNIIDIQGKKQDNLSGTTGGLAKSGANRYDETFKNVDTVFNDIQVLDDVIQKMANGLVYTDVIEVPLGIRAIEAKAKITNNAMGGLSLIGLREVKLRASAKTEAMLAVILHYIPEDQHNEVLEAIEIKEQEYYENLDLTEESKRITNALESAGIDF